MAAASPRHGHASHHKDFGINLHARQELAQCNTSPINGVGVRHLTPQVSESRLTDQDSHTKHGSNL